MANEADKGKEEKFELKFPNDIKENIEYSSAPTRSRGQFISVLNVLLDEYNMHVVPTHTAQGAQLFDFKIAFKHSNQVNEKTLNEAIAAAKALDIFAPKAEGQGVQANGFTQRLKGDLAVDDIKALFGNATAVVNSAIDTRIDALTEEYNKAAAASNKPHFNIATGDVGHDGKIDQSPSKDHGIS